MFNKLVLKSAIFLSLFSFFLLTSCVNFLNGDHLKEELDKHIEYANSPDIKVRIAGDSSVNFISGSGDYSLKATDKKEIDFELVSDDYYFEDWLIVEKNDTTKDASSFVDIKITNDKNSYATIITIKKGSPDLLLKPVTKLKPGISHATPAYYPTGVYFLKPINLYFTQPMKKTDLENWNHIHINNGINSIEDYFFKPELSESGTILTIRPKPAIVELARYSATEIKVTVDGDLKDAENSGYKTKSFTHSYVINNQADNTPPVLSELSVLKKTIDLQTREETYSLINDNEFSNNWSDDEFENHHTNETIFINFKGIDNSSGVKELKVTETLISGSGTVTDTSSNFIQITEGVFGADKLEYNLKTVSDDVIKLDFELISYNDKVSNKKTIYVVKYSAKPFLKITPKSDLRLPRADGTDVIDDIETVWASSEFYSNIYEPVSFKITYWDEGDENNVKTFVPTTVYKPENHQAAEIRVTGYSIVGKGYKIVRDLKKTTKVKMVAETKYGNKSEIIYEIPKSITINFDGNIDTIKSVYFSKPLSYGALQYYYQEKASSDSSYGPIKKNPNKYNQNIFTIFQNGYDYKLYSSYAIDGNPVFYSCSTDTLEFRVENNYPWSIDGLDYNISSSVYPNIQSRDIIYGPANSGVCYAKFYYSYRGATSRYDFKLLFTKLNPDGTPCKYDNGEDVYVYADSLDDTVILESGYKYNPMFACYDKHGYELNFSKNSGKNYSNYIIDTTNVHNKAPDLSYITFNDGYIPSPKNATLNVPSFITVDPNLEQKIYYYVVKNTDGLNAMSYTEEQLKNLTEYTFETGSDFIVKGSQTPVPIEIPENGYYTLFLKIKDRYGNYSIKPNVYSSFVNGEIDVATIKKADASSINMPFTNPLGSQAYYFDATNKQWTQSSNFISTSKITNNYVLKKGSSYTNQFAKIDSYTAADRIGVYHNYNKTVYLCPDYFLNSRTIKNKGVLELKNGYQIFIDQPTFVRILYSKTDWGEDADLWGTRGFETDCRVESSTFTYIPDTSKVPSGYYYCMVIHFADGTSTMGEVYKKQ